jgi:hypothetical protein
MSLNKKSKFDNKLPDRETGERGVDMEDVGRGNDGEEISLASLSLGSDTGNLFLLALAQTHKTWQRRMS